jgi:hypothetical protein
MGCKLNTCLLLTGHGGQQVAGVLTDRQLLMLCKRVGCFPTAAAAAGGEQL